MFRIPVRFWLSKIDQFLAHWPAANTANGSAITLGGGYALANLTGDRATVVAAMNAATDAGAAANAASRERDLKRAALRERMRQFNQTVRGLLPNTIYVSMLAEIPSFHAAPGAWAQAMERTAYAWNRINTDSPAPVGITPPLPLAGGYTRANFLTDAAAMNAAFTASDNTRTAAETARQQRDDAFAPVYERLKQYRTVIQGRFARTHAIYQSLPTLTPPPGHTPHAVSLSGGWIAADEKAHLVCTAPTDADIHEIELRASFGGTKYNADAADVIESHAPDDLDFFTDAGLAASGSVAYFKAFVINATGNEKGSNAVKVTRP